MSTSEGVVGVDVGGSSIKAAVVDVCTGQRISARETCDAPTGFGFEDVAHAISKLRGRFGRELPVGVGIPAVTRGGRILSPPTAHEVPGWVGKDLGSRLEALLGSRVAVLNDADAAGLAEVHFGAAKGESGRVIFLTLGTGIGSAVFEDGALEPNTELGKLVLPGQATAAERFAAPRVKRESGLGWDEWADRLALYLSHLDGEYAPRLIVVGGAISEEWESFLPRIRARAGLGCDLRPAALGNDAGLIGAAWALDGR